LENFIWTRLGRARHSTGLQYREVAPYACYRKIELTCEIWYAPPLSWLTKQRCEYEASRTRKNGFERGHGVDMNIANSLPLIIYKSHRTASPKQSRDRHPDSPDRAGTRVRNSTSGPA